MPVHNAGISKKSLRLRFVCLRESLGVGNSFRLEPCHNESWKSNELHEVKSSELGHFNAFVEKTVRQIGV
jgi:hypothetical protein